MKMFSVGFVAGALLVSVVFLVLDQETTGEDAETKSLSNTVSAGIEPSSAYSETNTEGQTRPEDALIQVGRDAPQQLGTTPGTSTTLSNLPGIDGPISNSPFEEFAESTQRTAEDVERMLERSFEFRGENRDRYEIFVNEVGDISAALKTFENTVTNEVWRVAGSTYPPVFLETECRSLDFPRNRRHLGG